MTAVTSGGKGSSKSVGLKRNGVRCVCLALLPPCAVVRRKRRDNARRLIPWLSSSCSECQDLTDSTLVSLRMRALVDATGGGAGDTVGVFDA